MTFSAGRNGGKVRWEYILKITMILWSGIEKKVSRLMDDFEFTCQLFAKFFNQKRIQKTLQTVYELDLSGWEKW